ncbi:PAS domain-containing protein, partial [bacterium]|nr:PAS domain-containing protein [bacterium]
MGATSGHSSNGTSEREQVDLSSLSSSAYSLIESAPVAIFCADSDLTITYMNPMSRRLFEGLSSQMSV